MERQRNDMNRLPGIYVDGQGIYTSIYKNLGNQASSRKVLLATQVY